MWISQLYIPLVNRSATKGSRVYRLYRDDAYLSTLLDLVGRVYRDYVDQPAYRSGLESLHLQTPQQPLPPIDLFFGTDPSYRQFLSHTARLARSARLVVAGDK